MKNIIFALLAVLIMSCARQTNNQTHSAENYEQSDNEQLIEENYLMTVPEGFFGLWRSESGVTREILAGEIRASGSGWSFAWRIDSVTAVRNNDEATKADYPYGFTLSGEVTVFNGNESVWIDIGFGSGKGLGEIYLETYYLHSGGDRFLTDGFNYRKGSVFYSRRLLNSEERFINWGRDSGVALNTTIIADNVAIHVYPSESSDVLFEVSQGTWVRILSTSNSIDTIDGHSGNWLQVLGNHPLGGGWVFSRYTAAGHIAPAELRVKGLEHQRAGWDWAEQAIASYEVDGVETTVYLWQHREESQDFHTFVFDRDITINIDDWRTIGLFHYRNVAGTYAWFPETGELRHITHMGSTMESAWVKFTDDFRFMLQDFGTAPGIRGINVWRLEDNELIYSGGYLDSINLRGNTINVVAVYGAWNIPPLDSETISFAENFIANNPVPEEIDRNREWFGVELVIIYELNLDTGVRQVVDAIWINTQ